MRRPYGAYGSTSVEMREDKLLRIAFAHLVKRGTLEVVTSRGQVLTIGDYGSPQVRIRFADAGAVWAFVLIRS